MLIEQDSGPHIDLKDIESLCIEEIVFDYNDITLIGKFVIIVYFKNSDIQSLTNVFEYRQQARLWIEEIRTLYEFYQLLKNYKV